MEKIERCDYTNKVKLTKEKAQKIIEKGCQTRIHYISGERMNRFRRRKREVRSYFCEYCGTFHVTSKEYARQKKNGHS